MPTRCIFWRSQLNRQCDDRGEDRYNDRGDDRGDDRDNDRGEDRDNDRGDDDDDDVNDMNDDVNDVKGDTNRPTSIVYRITPNDHISAALPEYNVLALRISGETYAGQPRLSCSKSSSGLSSTTASSSDSNCSCVLY